LSVMYVGNCCSDWLLSRRHCTQNWSQTIVPVREKINSAIQDMPAVEDVANLLRGTCLYIVVFMIVSGCSDRSVGVHDLCL